MSNFLFGVSTGLLIAALAGLVFMGKLGGK